MLKKDNSNPTKQCHFCVNNIKDIDYKDVESIKPFTDSHARIMKHRRTATCTRHQRKLTLAIKRARFMSLLPFISG
ncbi:MAG: 30S ribosomal protein S18 [Candidatus Vogelbacteria bacterium RIFOXYD1_FULL_46_19]|uniref:Small ribosomal subunit protein bS18 n=1 Tax=Candidatus Vogelbacteria bacterium RIFOXYD1_FULL_46_19 TaxID=1802439 RepID=A0A1G2QIK6_9BACT|nr:MAG: 30S ribosomal protein S18 [Candidatus Vogelbacteria bacterium RIFOXYD1_FULL_46_19]